VVKETNATTGNITDYLYGDDLIKQTKAANDSYFLYDGLGSTRALSDGIGLITDTYDYSSFGITLNQTGVTENSYLFTGDQHDSETDNYYLRARYYDPSRSGFTQMDTWMGNDNDVMTLHKYLYANADPVNNIDPSGNFSLTQISFGIATLGVLTTVANPNIQIGASDLDGSLDPLVPDHLTIGLLLLKNMVGPTSPLLSLLRDKEFGDEACTLIIGPRPYLPYAGYSEVVYTCRHFPGQRHQRFVPSVVSASVPRKAPCAPGFPHDMMPRSIQEGLGGAWKECHFR
jgi:RHS repeat-associated protein